MLHSYSPFAKMLIHERWRHMARKPRLVLPGIPHHITQRGIHRTNVFLCEDDVRLYRRLLREARRRYRLLVHAYCLMPNHVHVIATPERPDSLAHVFQTVHSTYAMVFNQQHDLSGYLWQNRFFSCPLDDDHLRDAIRYVERNPVRARLVSRAEDYPWSSASAHCGLAEDDLLDVMPPTLADITYWAAWLAEPNATEIDHRLRENTLSGRVCGNDEL